MTNALKHIDVMPILGVVTVVFVGTIVANLWLRAAVSVRHLLAGIGLFSLSLGFWLLARARGN